MPSSEDKVQSVGDFCGYIAVWGWTMMPSRSLSVWKRGCCRCPPSLPQSAPLAGEQTKTFQGERISDCHIIFIGCDRRPNINRRVIPAIGSLANNTIPAPSLCTFAPTNSAALSTSIPLETPPLPPFLAAFAFKRSQDVL